MLLLYICLSSAYLLVVEEVRPGRERGRRDERPGRVPQHVDQTRRAEHFIALRQIEILQNGAGQNAGPLTTEFDKEILKTN